MWLLCTFPRRFSFFSRPGRSVTHNIMHGCSLSKVNALQHRDAPLCELTGRRASVALAVTSNAADGRPLTLYFEDHDTATNAWTGSLCRYVDQLAFIMVPAKSVGSAVEREERTRAVRECKASLSALCADDAMQHLAEGSPLLAVPAAQFAVKLADAIHGEGSLEAVPARLCLSDAYVAAKYPQLAEDTLTAANWALLARARASNALRSRLRRSFGKLYASQGRYEEALRQLADDIYHCSLEEGPEHLSAVGGYFELANVFSLLKRGDAAGALDDKVVDCWNKYLLPGMGRSVPALSASQAAQGVEMLRAALKRREATGGTHVGAGEAHYVLALLLQHCGDRKPAKGHVRTACQIYESTLGANHPRTVEVQEARTRIEESCQA